jgi:hypothetical protein
MEAGAEDAMDSMEPPFDDSNATRRCGVGDDERNGRGSYVRDAMSSPPDENLRGGDMAVAALSPRGRIPQTMSCTLKMSCGCTVYVACHPKTRVAHTRVIEFRGTFCRVRRHDVGVRLFLWELLPERDEAQSPSVAYGVDVTAD